MNRVLFCGLPEAGKTTFLAALWHVLSFDDTNSSLSLEKVEGDRAYLKEIATAWQSGKEIGRTHGADAFHPISLQVKERDTSATFRLDCPDLSGERFQQQWTQRECLDDYVELARSATGVLLFIHPRRARKAHSTREGEELAGELEGQPQADNPADSGSRSEQAESETDSEGTNEEKKTTPVKPPEWEPLDAPTQVQLVDMLQSVGYLRDRTNDFSLGVVVSAWDLEEEHFREPAQWVERNLPLLKQYLQTSGVSRRIEYFGVSAQGGDYKTERDKILKHDRASDRIRIRHSGKTLIGDIALPIRWLCAPGTADVAAE